MYQFVERLMTVMEFLRFHAEADPDMQQHLKSCPRNAKYASHHIRNELINLCRK